MPRRRTLAAPSVTSRRRTHWSLPGVAVDGFVALAEGVETVAERYHHITRERVVAAVVNVIGRDVAADVRTLAQQVVGFE